MEDDVLKDAVRQLDAALRRLPFCSQAYEFSGRRVTLIHPIDNEGNIDKDYLVVSFDRNLPPYWMHRSTCSHIYYLEVLIREKLSASLIVEWASHIELAKKNPVIGRLAGFHAIFINKMKLKKNKAKKD